MASNVRQLQRAGLLGLAPTLAKFLPSAAFTTAAARLADLQVTVPPLGESITDGAIAAITKGPGDPVEEDDTLLSIETDKVTVDVRSVRPDTDGCALVRPTRSLARTPRLARSLTRSLAHSRYALGSFASRWQAT